MHKSVRILGRGVQIIGEFDAHRETARIFRDLRDEIDPAVRLGAWRFAGSCRATMHCRVHGILLLEGLFVLYILTPYT